MILVYTDKVSARIEYIFNQILCKVLGFKITFTEDLQEAKQSTFPLLNYSEKLIKNAVQVTPAGLLTQKGLDRRLPEVLVGKKRKIMFCTNHETFDFDLFSASFYLITRYEEYISQDFDEYGRFVPQSSLAFRNQFLLEPIVDQWANDFKEEFLAKFPDTPCTPPEFRYIPTIDVDNSFAFRHKGLIVNTCGLLSDLFKGEFELAKIRLKTVLRWEQDPFYRFSFMTELHDHYYLVPFYFIRRGRYGVRDEQVLYSSLAERKRLKKLARTDIVGFLSSDKSAFSGSLMKKEMKKLEDITKKQMQISRFHSIRFRLPDSYKMLLKLGIKKDFSMGYATTIGFRAGTSFPFYFYDLEKEQSTALQVYPFMVIEKTAKDVLKLPRREVISVVNSIADKVAKVNGTYVTIFHNEAFSKLPEWEKWRDVYRAILRHGSGLMKSS